jgi:hypothetical protein
VNRYLLLFIFLLISAEAFCGTKIYDLYAPQEIPVGDDFVVTVTCAPMDKGNNRVVVIDHPAQCSLKTVYAVSPKSPDELLLLMTDSEVLGFFQREKGRTTAAFRDESGVLVGEASVIVYYFVFTSTDEIPKATFKCALVERNDPIFKPEPVKDKKGKKKVKPTNPNWRMVNPPRGSDFKFISFPEELMSDVLFVSGWDDNSRALTLKGEHSSASLPIVNDSLGNLLWRSFSIGFWYRTVEPLQDIISIIRGSDTIRAFLDTYGQVNVVSSSEGVEEQILQSPYFNDGAWHHCLFSKDSLSVWRLFIDGELVDRMNFAYLSDYPKSELSFGNYKGINDIQLDELSVLLRAVSNESEIRSFMTVSARDTISDAFALFHFDEYGRSPRSSVYEQQADTISGKVRLRPIIIKLDTNAVIAPSTSPVLYEEAVLTVERPTPSKLNFDWRSSREYSIQSYQLERRIETFGEYQSVLRIAAKKYIPLSDTEASAIGRAIYSASETLPKISKDIDLYYRLGLVSADSSIRYTTPLKIEYGDAKDIFLEQNKPNPFNSKTTINYTLKKTSWLKMAVYDIMGREVLLISDAKTDAGKHTIEIDASNWPPGIYFYKAIIGKQTVTKRMVIVK